MDMQIDEEGAKPPSTSLVDRVHLALVGQIDEGKYLPGDRLPSEARLTEEFSVSRTVVREAIAILRSDGRVEARKGSGVFALAVTAPVRPFSDLDPKRVSEVIELLELRSAFEIRAANLAATRRSPAQIDDILAAHAAVGQCIVDGEPTREADFELHFRIAEATQNARFPEFLTLIREGIVPRKGLTSSPKGPAFAPNPDLQKEHAGVVDAILDGDPIAAEAAMKAHLDSSLRRYRRLLRTTGTE